MKTRYVYAVVFVMALSISASVRASELPETSIYHLDVELTDQHGTTRSLDTYRGHAVVLSMFYATCPNVCPVLISTIQRMERKLSADERAKLRVILVSVDPETDTPEILSQVAARHRIDLDRWQLARATPRDVRKIAAVLGVKYRKLPDGEFSHTTILTLVDADGVVRAHSAKIPGIDDSFFQAIRGTNMSAYDQNESASATDG
jgi:protein SCO1/2